MRARMFLSILLLAPILPTMVRAVEPDPVGVDGYSRDWILVRLEEPIEDLNSAGRFPPRTGHTSLDALIEVTGVHRIDHALRVSMRQTTSGERLSRHGLGRTYRFHLPDGVDVAGVIERFSRLAEVEYAEPDFVGSGGARIPNDSYFADQWGFHQASDVDVDGPEAWELAIGDGPIIAILDTGVDSDHVDFDGKLTAGYDFAEDDSDPEDDHGHGSNVAAIASAVTDNGIGTAGACWNCSIMPLKVLDENNFGLYSWWADAIVYAADQGARIYNLSAGGSTPSNTLRNAVEYAHDAGLIQVSITHNDDAGSIRYPGRYAQTIAVGGTDDLDRRASPFCYSSTSGSNWGPEIDVVAPGEWILGAAMGGGSNYWCGTSQAAPLVAGLAGIMRTLDPSVGRDEARHLIRSGAEDGVGRPAEDTAGFDEYHGWGRVNMQRTLQATLSSSSLRVEGRSATSLRLEEANGVASSYDFVRGDLTALSESVAGVDVGTVVCLENDSADPDTLGNEDTATPASGEAFFYLARFNAAPGPGSYGGSSRNRDRAPSAGGCAD